VPQEIVEDITFKIDPAGQLIVPKHIVDSLNKYQQVNYNDTEAGGILLGRQFENKLSITIDEITTPFKSDKRSRNSFYRSKSHHNYAVKRWEESDGYCLYLGLWHTHPEAIPIPSSIDYVDWTKAINQGDFDGKNLFFIIIGTEQVRCWQGARRSFFKRGIRLKNNFKQLEVLYE